MTSLKDSLMNVFGVLGAIAIAPFVAVFGLMMLGLGFGVSIIAVFVVTLMTRRAHASDATRPQTERAQPVL